MDIVKATWVGQPDCFLQLQDGSRVALVPHETVAEIGAGEAAGSENWQPVAGPDGPTVAELREQLEQHDLPTSGRKDELVARLADAGQTPTPAADADAAGDHNAQDTAGAE